MGQFLRVGQNPAKSIRHVAQPEKVTVAVTAYIPFLGGYYAHGLEVLKVCLGSILANTDQPFDLMVFDNASCPEAIQLLETLRDQGKIQFLILSSKNVGKVGAWNAIFGAAPGEYIAYSDMDVYYNPGWLSKHLEVFEAFPEAGTVAGLPRRGDLPLYTNTIRQLASLPDTKVEEGRLIPDEWILDHAYSLGKTQETIADEFGLNDYRISRQGVSAFATGTHFQFMVRADVVRQFLPFPNERPMGDSVAHFDRAIDGNHLLRLATSERVTLHMGNQLSGQILTLIPPGFQQLTDLTTIPVQTKSSSASHKFLDWKPVRKLLLTLYDRIFRLYYS